MGQSAPPRPLLLFALEDEVKAFSPFSVNGHNQERINNHGSRTVDPLKLRILGPKKNTDKTHNHGSRTVDELKHLDAQHKWLVLSA
jgi:hypothetical protein